MSTASTCLSNPSYKLDALDEWRRGISFTDTKNDPNPSLGPRYFFAYHLHLLHHILSCPMSIRQRAARARVQGDSKPESVARDHSKGSEVSKLLYSLSSLDIEVLDSFIDTLDFANPRRVPCDLCRGSLSRALLDGCFVSVTASTLLTRATWRGCYWPSIHCPRSSWKRERHDRSSEYSGGHSRYLGANNRLLQSILLCEISGESY